MNVLSLRRLPGSIGSDTPPELADGAGAKPAEHHFSAVSGWLPPATGSYTLVVFTFVLTRQNAALFAGCEICYFQLRSEVSAHLSLSKFFLRLRNIFRCRGNCVSVSAYAASAFTHRAFAPTAPHLSVRKVTNIPRKLQHTHLKILHTCGNFTKFLSQ